MYLTTSSGTDSLKELEDFLEDTPQKYAKPVIHPQQKWPIAM